VRQTRQYLTEDFILFQSASAETNSELTDLLSSKRCRSDHVSDENSTSFDSMIALGEETDAELIHSLSSAEVKIESYLHQPRNCSYSTLFIGRKNRLSTLF